MNIEEAHRKYDKALGMVLQKRWEAESIVSTLTNEHLKALQKVYREEVDALNEQLREDCEE